MPAVYLNFWLVDILTISFKLQLLLKQSSWHCVVCIDGMPACLAVPALLRVLTDAMASDMMQPKVRLQSV